MSTWEFSTKDLEVEAKLHQHCTSKFIIVNMENMGKLAETIKAKKKVIGETITTGHIKTSNKV